MCDYENGYIDIQVNGYGGVDYNADALSSDDLRRSCQKLQDDGTRGILATIITEHSDRMAGRLRRIVELRERDPLVKDVILGFHIEGPFINEQPGFRGGHPVDAIRPAEPEAMKRLLDAAGGLTRIVTLAPERDPGLRTTSYLAKQGITVAAGHTDASSQELWAAIDVGLSMFTHLGNGCPMNMHRHDNIVQRALDCSDQLWLCFIADGAHSTFPALRNYLRQA